jgi:hypothetical protein
MAILVAVVVSGLGAGACSAGESASQQTPGGCAIAKKGEKLGRTDIDDWVAENEGFAVAVCTRNAAERYYLLAPIVVGHFGVCQYVETSLGWPKGKSFREAASERSNWRSIRKMAPIQASCQDRNTGRYISVAPGISEGLFIELWAWWDTVSRSNELLTAELNWRVMGREIADDRKELLRKFSADTSRSARGVSAIEVTKIGEDVEFGPCYELLVGRGDVFFAISVDRRANRWRILRAERAIR